MQKSFFVKILILYTIIFLSNIYGYDYLTYSKAYQPQDYREAINMALKFFGGQRCGNTHNWMLYDNKENAGDVCHTQDGQGQWYIDDTPSEQFKGHDVSGGWHDCGDFIKVATTMGYAAVCLLTAYDIWPEAFEDNYDQNYNGPDGIPDVLNEVKVATDFFIKSFPDENTFVYYVGNGDYDHKVWATSAYQSTLPVEQGGDPRPVYATTTKGGPQAGDYAAALALMSILYAQYSKSYADSCLQFAKIAYNYAKNHTKTISIPTYYPAPNEDWWDEIGLAAALLYRITKQEEYLNDLKQYFNNKWESNAPLAWDTVADITYYYILQIDPDFNNGNFGYIRDFIYKNVFKLGIPNGESDPNGYPYFQNKWGTNKLASGSAFAAALLLKLNEQGIRELTEDEKKKAENYIYRVVDYMLGNNEFGHPFLHGFKGDMTFKVHHRNAMGVDNNPPDTEKNNIPFMFASGALIGGPQGPGDFTNDINNYINTESGDDYNAPFVGAIAYIVAKESPAVVKNNINKKLDDITLKIYPNPFNPITNLYLNKNIYVKNIKIFNSAGKLIENKKINKTLIKYSLDFSKYNSGIYFILVESKIGKFYKKALLIK